ncbi:hypothetical protein VTN77DRAFT_8992 [Rasamsonia byssochlamydoides]|uniref:uncharacterized protein n=1 Tax=Rasamsonia byssochlamydoides TaxID=89139 RepID=UPI00374282CA
MPKFACWASHPLLYGESLFPSVSCFETLRSDFVSIDLETSRTPPILYHFSAIYITSCIVFLRSGDEDHECYDSVRSLIMRCHDCTNDGASELSVCCMICFSLVFHLLCTLHFFLQWICLHLSVSRIGTWARYFYVAGFRAVHPDQKVQSRALGGYELVFWTLG